MSADDGVREQSRIHGPLLDVLQGVLEEQIGPLLWRERRDAKRSDDGHIITVGPIVGSGVALETITAATLRNAINEVLSSWGFHDVASFVEEEWGEWHVTVSDGHQALLTVSIRAIAKAWVEVRVT